MTFGRVFLRNANRQTNRHTDTLITILQTPDGGGGEETTKPTKNSISNEQH